VVGAFAVASAVFLIVELSTPYGGLLRLPPTPLVQAIDALGH
jgi:predicted benzoate:H+ symporter BenE